MLQIRDDPLIRAAERTGYAPWVRAAAPRQSALRLHTDISRALGKGAERGGRSTHGKPDAEGR